MKNRIPSWCRFLLLFFAFALISTTQVDAQKIFGSIVDAEGQALPFTSIYIKGTTNGTTSNSEGNYVLHLQPGDYEVVFSFLGYKNEIRNVRLGDEAYRLDIILNRTQYSISEVTIDGTEDPAYRIMRKVIENKNYYKNQIESFSCEAYVKGVQRLIEYPKKILGNEVDLSEIIDTSSGIIYLSESVSDYYFKKPDQYKETVRSSKFSGNSRAYTFNQARSMEFNFYENIIDVGDLNPRGYISPISNNAFFYYRFELMGSEFRDGILVYKIKVSPKRNADPVFRGELYVNDSLFNIANLKLNITKETQLNFLDTLSVEFEFKPSGKDQNIWVPFKKRFGFYFSFFGFKGDGEFTGVFSKYNINPSFEKRFFKGEVLKVEKESNNRDQEYWEKIRPVPLTEIERKDYQVKDSLSHIRSTEVYRDSIDRKSNKFKPGALLLNGYTYQKSFKELSISTGSLIESVQFNTVQGLNLDFHAQARKEIKEKGIEYFTKPNVGYGFADKTFLGGIDFRLQKYSERLYSCGLSIGRAASQLNANNPVYASFNTFYSLLNSQNDLKLYQQDFVKLFYQSWIKNQLNLNASLQYGQRSFLKNRSLYSFKDSPDSTYSSNMPFQLISRSTNSNDHSVFLSTLSVSYNPGMEYYSRPNRIIHIGSKWPTFKWTYQVGMNTELKSHINFQKLSLSITDDLKLGMIGNLSLYANAGTFLQNKQTSVIDYFHFNGNQTIFSAFSKSDFLLLNYYSRSTTNDFFQIHAQHNLGGLLLNKIPGIRKLNLNEYVGVNALITESFVPYYEFHFSIAKLDILRLGYSVAFEGNSYKKGGFIIGLAFLN